MSTRRRLIFLLTTLLTATFYFVSMSTSSALALASGDSHGQAPTVLALGLQEGTCDEVDDATNDETCDEVNSGDATEEQSGETNDTCQQSEDATDQDACEAVDQATNEGNHADGATSTTDTGTGDQDGHQPGGGQEQNAGQTTDGPAASDGGGAKESSTEPSTPSGPLASVGRWVTQVASGVAHVVGGLVTGVANLFEGRTGSSTQGSNASGQPGSASANDQSGQSASAGGVGASHEGDAPAPWWKAWLPNTGSQWLVFAVVVAVILIGAGLALRSVRRHRHSAKAQLTS